ncbi:MAG: hypothetical protein ACJ8F7_02165 [Gemmataceae bacterium]
MILLDTDHVSVLTDQRAAAHAALVARLASMQEPLAIPIVAVEEQCQGWLAKLHRTRDIYLGFNDAPICPFLFVRVG